MCVISVLPYYTYDFIHFLLLEYSFYTNFVSAIRHINKEKLYLDSIKEIIYCYDKIVCCSQKKNKYRHYPILFLC